MTLAICMRCGAEKLGGFSACPGCGFRPSAGDDLARSLMLTDHYVAPDDLRRLGRDIAAGRAPTFRAEDVALLRHVIAESGYYRVVGLAPPPERRPWWRRLLAG